MAITPTKEQFSKFARGRQDGEVVMINLLHFAKQAGESESESESESEGEATAAPHEGQAAYRDYSDQVIKMVEARGGKVIWIGRPEQVLIGDSEAEEWDLVAMVSYPNRAAFIDMVTSPSYGEAHTHRERGLDRSVLLACEPMMNALPSRDGEPVGG